VIDVGDRIFSPYKNTRFFEQNKKHSNILKKMQRIKILIISFSIIVALMDKAQINGKQFKRSKEYEVKPMRLRTFTPLKDLRVLANNNEVEQKLQEEKQAV
jgi:hypothetical protein